MEIPLLNPMQYLCQYACIIELVSWTVIDWIYPYRVIPLLSDTIIQFQYHHLGHQTNKCKQCYILHFVHNWCTFD